MNSPTGPLAQRLANGPVLCAEGYLFELERRGYIKAGPFVPEVVLDHPEAIRQLHREFLRAGSDVMVAFTYYAHRDKLRDVGRESDLEPMNRHAVRIAKEVAAESGALVAGNICNTWEFDPNDADRTGAMVRAMYEEQVGWAADEGADFILSETHDFLGEALLSIDIAKAHDLEIVVNFNSVQPDKTRDGYDYIEACKIAADNGADVVGFNCSRGPRTLTPMMEQLTSTVSIPTATAPVPYRTTPESPMMETLTTDGFKAFPLALDPHVCTRGEMGDFAKSMVDLGVGFIGICCGGGPHHVRSMAEAMSRTTPASRYSPDLELHPVHGDPKAKRQV